jgi:hypothetical protein
VESGFRVEGHWHLRLHLAARADSAELRGSMGGYAGYVVDDLKGDQWRREETVG